MIPGLDPNVVPQRAVSQPITATRRYELDMGHCLPNHSGPCHRPHGHRYVVEVTVACDGPVLGATGQSDEGMVTDFGLIKHAMAMVLDRYDHRFLMSANDQRLAGAKETFGLDAVLVVAQAPTAEYLAVLWGGEIRAELMERAPDTYVREVVVWETPNARAHWRV